MNLLLTNYCNKQCPYCFAGEKLVPAGSAGSRAMTLKDLRTAIAFLKRSQQKRVNIMGGEPTLHPEFKKAISMVVKAGLDVTLFTNGLMSTDNALFLKSLGAERCALVLNINAFESYPAQEWSAVNRTMGLFNNKGIALGFTVYRPDFSLDFCADLIRKYCLNTCIRVGIAAPVAGGRNAFLRLADYPRVADKLARFADSRRAEGITFSFDCGFIFCAFTDEQLGTLFRRGSPLASYCMSAIDVGPDLRLWRCFATSLIWNKRLADFNDLQSAMSFYEKSFKAFRKAGIKAECLGCEQLKSGRCCGGCLGHTLQTFKVADKLNKIR